MRGSAPDNKIAWSGVLRTVRRWSGKGAVQKHYCSEEKYGNFILVVVHAKRSEKERCPDSGEQGRESQHMRPFRENTGHQTTHHETNSVPAWVARTRYSN
jgi:hypothetical protein